MLRKRLELVSLFVKAPIEKFDHVEAQTVHNATHDSHCEVDRVPNQKNDYSQQYSNTSGCKGTAGQAVEYFGEFDRRQAQRKQS